MRTLKTKIKIAFSLFLLSLSLQPAFAATLNDNKSTNYQSFIVYWGGWFGMVYDLQHLPSNVSTVNLAFANIDETYHVNTQISGYLTNIPKEDGSQLQPSYINWTMFKYNRPQVKTLLSVGGSTFSQIWTNTLNDATADIIAKNIADVINQTYPVYKGNFASPADRLGDVTIDGVDLDVETGGARLSDQVSTNVITLIQHLKHYLNPGKIITFTGFSVGADTNDDQCTAPGSVHCGEDVNILKRAGNLLDWVNVMAYDAGQAYAKQKYQTALANYAAYLDKNKITLGLDIQPQWDANGSFKETAEELANKAAWQKANQYGGAMLWGVNVSNNAAEEQKYVDTIAKKLG